MNESEPLDPLPEGLEQLFDSARADGFDPAQSGRVWTNIERGIRLGKVATIASVVTVVLVGGGIVGALVWGSSVDTGDTSAESDSPVEVATSETELVPTAPTAVPLPLPDDEPVEVPPTSADREEVHEQAPAPRPARPPMESQGTEEEEVPTEGVLLLQARRTLASSPAECLRWLRTHRQHYPRGALTEEREALTIDALMAAGQQTQAHDRSVHFLRRFPNSAHATRVRRQLNRGRGVD